MWNQTDMLDDILCSNVGSTVDQASLRSTLATTDVRNIVTAQVPEWPLPSRVLSATAESHDGPVLMVRVDPLPPPLNDSGESTWDHTIQFVGQLIKATIGPRDIAAHYSSDQFIIMVHDSPADYVELLVNRLHIAIDQANSMGMHPVPINVSIGVALGDGEECHDLAARAKAALPLKPSEAPSFSSSIIASIGDSPVILIVDDDQMVASFIQESLAGTNAQTRSACRVDEALRILHREKVDVVITDIHMPGASGFEMLAQIQTIDASIVVIVITGCRDLELAVKVIRSGADDFLMKPFTPVDLRSSVSNSLRKRQLILNGKAYQALLKSQVHQHAQNLQLALQRLESTYRETLQALGAALDTRDIETHAHSERVAQYALTLGRVIKMSVPELTTLERGVYLHDIGKIGIPDRVLLKDGSLRQEEWDVMKRHPQLGYRLASRVEFLKDAAKIILAHHERYDGTGYPYGLCGETIPLGARVFAVVDALDAITSDRPYRKARPLSAARVEIASYRGAQFDPQIIDAFMSIPEATWTEIRESVTRQVAACQSPSEDQLVREAYRSFCAENQSTI